MTDAAALLPVVEYATKLLNRTAFCTTSFAKALLLCVTVFSNRPLVRIANRTNATEVKNEPIVSLVR